MNIKKCIPPRAFICSSLGMIALLSLSIVGATYVPQESIDRVLNAAPLGSFLNPWELGEQNELLEFEFEDADLSTLVDYIQERFALTFITDDAIKPAPKGSKGILGTKITFKTHAPLNKKEAWSVFLKFLDLAGLAIVPGPAERIYRITAMDKDAPLSASKGPLPTFIGTNPEMLPDNDSYIRYVAFVRDLDLNVVVPMLDSIKSTSAPKLINIPEVRGILITDKAYNIKVMMDIINHLDNVATPEVMETIQLKRADATKVAKLYEEISKTDGPESLASRVLGNRKAKTVSYFAPGTKVFAEPRTNKLILIGSEDAVKRIEQFIVEEIDEEITKPYAPIHIYPLKFTQADAVAQILMSAVKFQNEGATDATKIGGVRDGNSFFKALTIVPEKSGNRLIITADYEDYLKIHEVLERIDVEQPQVAMKVLVIDVDITDTEQFGMQIRNKKPGVDGLLSDKINFQTSGLAGTSSVVENPSNPTGTGGATRLLGNLVSLATGGAVGSTFIAMGSDCYGVWGMLRILQAYTQANVVANPFLITTNNYPAQISLGQTRRVLTGTSVGAGAPQNAFGNLDANLSVSIVPQISYEGFVTLKIAITDDQFTTAVGPADDSANGNRIERRLNTTVILANNEVLALGGLVREGTIENETGVPILKDIPILGWFFKNKQKVMTRTSQIVLIAPEIIPPNNEKIAHKETAAIIKDAEANIAALHTVSRDMDPVHRWFFGDLEDAGQAMIDRYIGEERRYLIPNQEKVEGKKKKLSDYL